MDDMPGQSSDEQLLQHAAANPDGFGVFYRRHERAVLGLFMRATGRSDLALDLTAETFARALECHRAFDAARGSARGWLFGIARHVVAGSLEMGRVQSTARVRQGMSAITLDDRLAASIEETVEACDEQVAADLLRTLTLPLRLAVQGRVIDERPYPQLARELECSEALVRQRVHRGLALIRRNLEADR